MRELRVSVREIGESGCLVESEARMDLRAVGRLLLQFGSEAYGDDIQVVGCQARRGAGGLYRVSVQFLWTSSPHTRSIRHGVNRHVAMLFDRDKSRVM